MFKVYWTDFVTGLPCAEQFSSSQLTEALSLCQRLRNSGQRFVSMASQDIPGDCTRHGVDEVGPDYDWKKRR